MADWRHGGFSDALHCDVDFPLFLAAKALDFFKRLVLHPQTRKVSTATRIATIVAIFAVTSVSWQTNSNARRYSGAKSMKK